MAALGWTADQAWRATLHELLDAFRGYREINDPEFRKQLAFAKFRTRLGE